MSYYMVDCETDGPCPGVFSMVSIGAVIVRGDLSETFFGKFAPISDKWNPEALAISKITREEHEAYPDPEITTKDFRDWVDRTTVDRPIFISDNNGFDWCFVNYYLWTYLNDNPFGWSSRNINDVFHGMKMDMRASFRHLRKTKHDHNPVNDAKGNAEAFQAMVKMGLKVNLV